MFDALTAAESTQRSLPESMTQSPHIPFIAKSIPDWLLSTRAENRTALKQNVGPAMPWYDMASAQLRGEMKRAFEDSWVSQNETDKTLNKIQEVETFAEQLLITALKDKYGITLDVKATYLRLYCPKGIVVGFDVRTLSLLEASLHNFEVKETRAGYFDRASDFITKPSASGQFDVVPIKHKLSVEAFAALCRELDIGARYQAYLKAFMGFTNPVARAVLQHKVQASQQDALRAASVLALMKQDIDHDTHRMLLNLVAGHQALTLQGQPMHCYELRMMDTALTGIVLIAADLDSSRQIEQVIAYVPHDPEHPVKQYPSLASFHRELISQLRSPEYQRFFSRFVPHQQRGTFFFQLNNRLSSIQWHASLPFEQKPAWREEPNINPDLRMTYLRNSGDFWTRDFHQKLNKILNDARAMAVPTGDEDEKTRWARWDSFQKVAAVVLEAATFVATLFVPLLGELMLAYTAYQLLDETFEGIVEWSEGQRSEAAGHLIGVAESLIQLGAFAAGGKVVGTLLPLKSSPFIEGMRVVEKSDGRSRLWDADLQRYAQSISLDESVRLDEKGIYRHSGQEVLPLDGTQFVIEPDPGSDQYRIQHPRRGDAYAPRLVHNGVGAWAHEAERPQTWQGVTLMRRLGHRVDSFSDQTLEQIRIVSGVDDAVLRKLHVEHERPPALLVATIKRFTADQEVKTFIERISSRDPQVYGQADVQTQLKLLTGHRKWPKNRTVQWLDAQDKVLWQSSPDLGESIIKVRSGQTGYHDLAATMLSQLQEQEVKTLLDEAFGNGIIALDVRAARLRALIATAASEQETTLVDARFSLDEAPVGPDVAAHVGWLRSEFPQLPGAIMDELLVGITEAEQRQMSDRQHLPFRLRQEVRTVMREWRIVRAYEGLYLPSSANLDTSRLALHSLERLPGWSPEVRIEIRNQSFEGPLLDSIGPEHASIRKVLVRTMENTFQSHDEEGNTLHGADDFYTALLQALPDAARRKLGHEIGQGIQLRQTLQNAPLTHAALREILPDPPIRHVMDTAAATRLRGAVQGYARINEPLLGTGGTLSLEDRFKVLYPQASADTFADFVRSSGSQTQALRGIGERELEFEELTKALDSWVAIERGELLPMDQRYHKGRFAKAIKQCWQAALTSGPDGYALDLNFHWTSDFLEYLPALNADFRHVSSLQFRHVELRTDITGFLRYFSNLRALDLSDNALVAAPRLQESLPVLEHLNLSNNQLTLTADSVADLAGLTRLQTLRLAGNPALSQQPDVSRMAELHLLDLHDTGITEWPTGLLTLPRPRAFELDLQGNPIEQVPQVTPGSEQARLVARTRLSRDRLSDQGREQFQSSMRSVGYDPARSYPPKGEETSVYWLEGLSGAERQSRQTLWDELEGEPNAQGFFEVLEQLADSADYVEEASRPELTQRVWRLLDAAAQDTPLREELFRMASNPDSCADAGAQIFNEMGFKVLVHEAYLAGSPEQIETSLIRLAKGKSRLDQVNEIARATVQSRLQAGESFMAVDEDGDITGTIDEVEVYLAFQTGLADRLDLPWQSRGMLFREMAEVSDAQIDQAHESVLTLEAGEGLVNRIIEQRFWCKYLKSRHAQAFAQNSTAFNARSEELLNRHLAGTVSQQVYERELLELAEGRKGLLRTLTAQAWKKAA
jgi:hypothetical protein